jgi:threonine/homoserine/homoserine lactone efflux protein
MIVALAIGVVSGIVLSIPPGPLSAAVVKHSIGQGFRSGFLVALGGAVMDIVYVLVAAFASSALVTALFDLATGSVWPFLVFQILCIAILLVMGIRYIRQRHEPNTEERILKVEEAQERKAERLGHPSPFVVGVLIAVANLAAPTFIPSMISTISYLQANGWLSGRADDNVAYACGFGVGTVCWFSIVAKLLVRHRLRFTPGVLSTIYRFAGATFIVCACVLTYHVVMSTDWTILIPPSLNNQ